MIEDIVGNNGTRFIIAAGAVAVGLLCLVAVLWFMRNRPSSPFIRGGKNRQPRLAVLDAAAVDTRRRLVLVRRDDIEHLIMIGGPTDIVIESRIVSQTAPQAAATLPLAETVAARPAAERRSMPQPESRPAPVSAMGQVLYGENTGPAPTQTVRAVQPSQARPQQETAPLARQPIPERALPVQTQTRPQPVTAHMPPPVTVETAKSPEDILEAARTRVLAANQPVSLPRPAAQTMPLASTTASLQSPKDASAIEFERILDAEITGDLGKLTAEDVGIGRDLRANTPSSNPPVRQEPRLAGAAGERAEPSLEDEMNRMLNEIAVNRKS